MKKIFYWISGIGFLLIALWVTLFSVGLSNWYLILDSFSGEISFYQLISDAWQTFTSPVTLMTFFVSWFTALVLIHFARKPEKITIWSDLGLGVLFSTVISTWLSFGFCMGGMGRTATTTLIEIGCSSFLKFLVIGGVLGILLLIISLVKSRQNTDHMNMV